MSMFVIAPFTPLCPAPYHYNLFNISVCLCRFQEFNKHIGQKYCHFTGTSSATMVIDSWFGGVSNTQRTNIRPYVQERPYYDYRAF